MIKISSGYYKQVKTKWYQPDKLEFNDPLVSTLIDDTLKISTSYHIDFFNIEINENEYQVFKKFLPQYCPIVGSSIEFRGQLGFHIAKLLKMNWIEFRELS